MLTPPDDAVLDAIEPGWAAVMPGRAAGEGGVRSWLGGEPHGDRCRVRFFYSAADGRASCRVWFGPGTEGPPGHVHGGCITTVLDSVMGGCAWLNGHPVLAANLHVDFRASVPLGALAVAEATIEAVSGRKVTVYGALRDAGGAVFAEARGLFVIIPEERLQALYRRRSELAG